MHYLKYIHTFSLCKRDANNPKAPGSPEVAIQLQVAQGEVPRSRKACSGAEQNHSEKPKGQQSIGTEHGPWSILPAVTQCLIIVMCS